MPNELNCWEFNDTKDGIVYKPTEYIIQAYQELFQRVFPELNLDTSTPQGQLIEDLVNKDTQTLQLIQEIANSFFNGGNGRWLDNTLWLNFRLLRKKDIKSSVIVNIEGKPGIIIPNNFQISDGNNIFTIIDSYTIPVEGKGTFLFIGGMEQVNANTLTNIVTPLEGIYRVNNPEQSTQPIPEESDTDFYKRALEYQSISNSATLSSIVSYVYQVEGVKKVAAYENFTGKPVVYKNVTFDPHSFGIAVSGGISDFIAKAIQDKKAPGPAMVGNTAIILPDPTNPEIYYTYMFFRPSSIEIFFEIKVKLYPNSPSNYESVIKKALIDYISKKGIGETITQGECISNILSFMHGNIEIETLKLGKDKSAIGYTPVEIDFAQEAFTLEDSITITGSVVDANKSNIYSKNLKVSQ